MMIYQTFFIIILLFHWSKTDTGWLLTVYIILRKVYVTDIWIINSKNCSCKQKEKVLKIFHLICWMYHVLIAPVWKIKSKNNYIFYLISTRVNCIFHYINKMLNNFFFSFTDSYTPVSESNWHKFLSAVKWKF